MYNKVVLIKGAELLFALFIYFERNQDFWMTVLDYDPNKRGGDFLTLAVKRSEEEL